MEEKETKVTIQHEEAGASVVVNTNEDGSQDSRIEKTPERTTVEIEEEK